MDTNTALNACNRLSRMIDSIYSAAESYQLPHQVILDKLKKEIWEDQQLKRCPQWVYTRLRERSSMRLEEIQRYKVIWAFDVNGSIKLWEEMTEEERNGLIERNETGAHYWLKIVNVGSKWQSRDSDGVHMVTRYKITGKKF